LKKIAITGQIGTGKSVLLNQFKFLGYKTYSSDQMVKELYAKDKHIINEIKKLNPSLVLNKKIRFDELSNKAFKEPGFLLKLEKLIHPRLHHIRSRIIKTNQINRNINRNIIVFEVPLLFEKRLQNNFDLVILLKCQNYLQIKRVLKRKNMNREKFENINKKFIPERKKIILSDYVINSGIGKNHTMSKIKELIKKHA
jgi:dephospho-CoA kinase